MKQVLNQNFEETGLFFRSFTVSDDNSRRNRSRGRGTGFCRNMKCGEPPSVVLSNMAPNRRSGNSLDLFTNIKEIVVELPGLEYKMKHEVETDTLIYGADFNENAHECSWPGVVCDDRNLVIELRVENNN